MLDWRDESCYEFTGRLTSHMWAWEFLRRNPEYRAFCVEWEMNYRKNYGALVNAMDRLSPEATNEEFNALPEHGPIRALEQYCLEFGVKYAVDPAEPYRSAGGAFGIRLEVETILTLGGKATRNRIEGKEWPGYPRDLDLRFSLAFPIEGQLQDARRLLEKYRAKAVHDGLVKPIHSPKGLRFRTGEFKLYLRLLDAKLQSAPMAEIGRVLFLHAPTAASDPTKSAKKKLDTALRMARIGYRRLLLEPERLLQ